MPGAGFVPGHLADPPGLGHFGLASMRQQIEMAGGVVRVRSRPGRGTTVTATLPMAGAGRAAEASHRPGPVESATGGRDGG
jgi:signal transduction histidine kinase